MTTTDRTGADTATFEAELARLDRLEVADEDTVERVARAMCASDAETHGTYTWDECSEELREEHRRGARAAIAALKPAPGTDSSGQMVVDVLRNGEHVATLDAVYGSVSVDSSGQVVQRVEPGLSAESNGRRLVWFTDAELEVELTRRAAVAGPQRDEEGGQ